MNNVRFYNPIAMELECYSIETKLNTMAQTWIVVQFNNLFCG